MESPYSPPDSDGTPLGSPNGPQNIPSAADCSLILPDVERKGHSLSNHLEKNRLSQSASPIRSVCFTVQLLFVPVLLSVSRLTEFSLNFGDLLFKFDFWCS